MSRSTLLEECEIARPHVRALINSACLISSDEGRVGRYRATGGREARTIARVSGDIRSNFPERLIENVHAHTPILRATSGGVSRSQPGPAFMAVQTPTPSQGYILAASLVAIAHQHVF